MLGSSSASSWLAVAAAAVSSSLLLLPEVSSQTTSNAASYDGCDASTYYSNMPSDTSSWTRSDVAELLADTHRKILPVQEEGDDDVYVALIDLFPGQGDDPNNTVQLAFRDVPMAIYPFANSQTWQRANLWPEERISATLLDAGAKTDIHSNVPADSTVFASKGRLFFGECGLFEDPKLCVSLPETNLTYTDGKIWQTPEAHRGAHARSILYMATRYMSAAGTNSSGLELVDCPPFASTGEFGYLSILLEWHATYPVTDDELARNDRACQRWQGNRNPFVDYPELATTIFGQPDTLKSGARQYESCFVNGAKSVETDSPTATPNACQAVEPGDIQIILTNGDDPTQIAFFTLDEIPAAVGKIYVTDRPWDGTQILDNGEGVISFTVPETTTDSVGRTCNGLCPGYVFGYGFKQDVVGWSNDTNFDLGISGDTILTYCINADGIPIFIHGLSYAKGGWANESLTAAEYGQELSALPEELKQFGYGSVQLPYHQNNVYNGSAQGLEKKDLLKLFSQVGNYMGSNQIRYEMPQLDGPSTSGATTTGTGGAWTTILSALVVVAGALVL